MMADGTVARLEIPEEYDVYITVEVDGKSNDTGFYTQGNKFLAAGSTYTINTKYAVCSCVSRIYGRFDAAGREDDTINCDKPSPRRRLQTVDKPYCR